MPRRHCSHSTECKQKVVAEYQGGEALLALGSRRTLIRIWIEMGLSRWRCGLSVRIGSLSLEGQGAFPPRDD